MMLPNSISKDVEVNFNLLSETSIGAAAPLYLAETLTETVIRRMSELKLTTEDMDRGLYLQSPGLERINIILAEEDHPTFRELGIMLHYVGMEMVAITSATKVYQGRSGHWYVGSRCQYCGVNNLDADLYDTPDETCPSKPE